MKVTTLSASEITRDFVQQLPQGLRDLLESGAITSRQVIALTAIRTCYSATKPSEIAVSEWSKYFSQDATDGGEGKESDRLFRHIVNSGHTSTLESITYTFAIEGVSRALLAQLTRHRVGFSFSVQSQRYVRFGSDDKTGGFDYVVPPSVTEDKQVSEMLTAKDAFMQAMMFIQAAYDQLRAAGVPAEDARMVLPNAAATNLTMTANLRALLDFYGKRRKGRGAQWEIAELAEQLRAAVVAVDPWMDAYFAST
ncbi:FAD-dependent thymidylate synthase [Brevibacillus borstelensis]|uniref:FAD-dependent thymidylate synthase n=1 Tax=Brevibacillus borstelensis TaxID=45462 RepID=UPI00287F4C3B|nr:FAD-dependent thymidylate synthase [Brevibacillus borstelensis]WNF07455.1 FAD-dependent thymidylate synthase [Brevibacillus borstelensis]